MSDKPSIAARGASKAEAKAVQAKVEFIMSMCGKDPSMRLTALSYALVFSAIEAEVTFASLIKNLAEMYDVNCEEIDEENEE
jgi:hypothetical protein